MRSLLKSYKRKYLKINIKRLVIYCCLLLMYISKPFLELSYNLPVTIPMQHYPFVPLDYPAQKIKKPCQEPATIGGALHS